MVTTGENPSIGEAITIYTAGKQPKGGVINRQELLRFQRWFGKERQFEAIAPAEVEKYSESFSPSEKDFEERLKQIRTFLAFVKKKGWCATNLSVHIKVKKAKTRPGAKALAKLDAVAMTKEGYASLEEEIAELKEERIRVTEEIRKAAADKDFRENAPLHAARERKGIIEGKLMELETTLKAAVIQGDSGSNGQKVSIGDCVVCCDMSTGKEVKYTLVSPREVNPLKGKISNVSPIGKALIGRDKGDEVEIKVPVGSIRYEIKSIER